MKEYNLIVGSRTDTPNVGFVDKLNEAVRDGWEIVPASLWMSQTSSGDLAGKAAILLVKEIEKS